MRKFKPWVKLTLFFSSYVPLFIIIALELGTIPPYIVESIEIPRVGFEIYISYIMIAIFVACILFTWLLYRMIAVHSSRGIRQRKVDSYQQRNELLSTYLLVYVFVFAGLDFTQMLDLAIFLIFFIMVAILQIKSEMLHVNPMLGICGYRIYEVRSGEEIMLIISDSRIEEKLISPEMNTSERRDSIIELVNLGPTTYLAP